MKTLDDVKRLPYAWVCTGGRSCPARSFGTDPEQEAKDGCPSCQRTAIDSLGNGTDYRLEAH